ncbi:MAG TPA: type VII secretion integral membrane protein EccD [Pseudonocardia sp.]|uniref:type VII secretion integral membrane protein EccD n=1 Tax=Pseudonocardia sp. TaxID=60912 RepID=UPI002ED83D7B
MTRPDTGMDRADTRLDGTRFCRVTVLAPRSRMDLALPTDLTVAELVPMLTELAGELGTGPRGPAGTRDREGLPTAWCLAAAAGAELPPHATLAGLGVLDGDLLRLRRRSEAPPPPVFDDPVDAVAEAVRAPDGEPGAWAAWADDPDSLPEPFSVRPWNARCRRVAGLAAGLLAVLGAAILLAAVRGLGEQANGVASVIGALGASAALAGGVRTARRDEAAAVLLATAAMPLASAAGFAALPGVPSAGHLLLAASLAAAASAAGLALLGTAAPLLVGAALATALTSLTALLGVFGAASPSGLAAGAATVAVGMLPLLPQASIRLAGLPAPVIPSTEEDMVAADTQWEFASTEEIRYQARLAHTYLAGLVLGASAVASVGAVLAAAGGGWSGQLFAALVVAVLLLRSRGYVTAAASAAPLAGGLLAGLALVAGLAAGPAQLVKLAGVGVLLVAGAIAVCLVWAGPRREPSPVLRRAVDIVEAVLVVATFPVALAVLDLYQVVRGL